MGGSQSAESRSPATRNENPLADTSLSTSTSAMARRNVDSLMLERARKAAVSTSHLNERPTRTSNNNNTRTLPVEVAVASDAERKLWVGNLYGLDGVVDDDFIRQSVGEQFHRHVTNVELVRKGENKLTGYGFITFDSDTAAQGCLALINGEPMPSIEPTRLFTLKLCRQLRPGVIPPLHDESPRRTVVPATTVAQSTARPPVKTGANCSSTTTAASAPPLVSQTADCCLCFDRPVDCVLYRCGHENLCFECAQQLLRTNKKSCPVCRSDIVDVIKTYR